MFRIDDATAASSLPAPEAAGTEGYFTEGNPTAGTPATNVRGSWLNMIQEELSAILAAAGITRSKTTYNQVNAALKSMYSSVVGSVRNLSMSVPTALATATMTADEIIVETALGGQTYRLASFNKTINLATTGAGGMDTGTVPTSGWVALYAIFNPTTGASALLAQNASSTYASNIYSGANMPAGYTASALVSIAPIAASKFSLFLQTDRRIDFAPTNILFTAAAAASYTALTIFAPPSARTVKGLISISSSAAAANFGINVAATAATIGGTSVQGSSAAANAPVAGAFDVPVNNQVTPQTIFYQSTISSGSATFIIQNNGYTF